MQPATCTCLEDFKMLKQNFPRLHFRWELCQLKIWEVEFAQIYVCVWVCVYVCCLKMSVSVCIFVHVFAVNECIRTHVPLKEMARKTWPHTLVGCWWHAHKFLLDVFDKAWHFVTVCTSFGQVMLCTCNECNIHSDNHNPLKAWLEWAMAATAKSVC